MLAVTQRGLGFLEFRAIFDLQFDITPKIRTIGGYYRVVALPLYVYQFVLNPTETWALCPNVTESQTENMEALC
jgi:hypothetical protein